MAKREEFIELARSQLGYPETGNNVTKYSKYFDTPKSEGGAWQWFNTKKQSSAWCAIWICWLFCQLLGPDKALTFLGCPSPKNNCAAGVPYLWKYMKALGWQVDKAQGQPGDIIFLNGNKHVGMIESVDSKYHTIEGNKGDKVARGSYGINSSTVYGICRPNWSAIDTEPTPAPAPTPSPAPAPTPAPSYPTYKVKTNTGVPLRLRAAPNTKSAILALIPNGTTITVTDTSGNWARTTYKGYTGWCSMTYLKKV